MNITPIEIRQKEFERHFRGYDKDEVNAFLHTLSQAWERMLQENREKSVRLEQAEKDIEKVREVEGSLFRTLRTAEDTSSEIISKAQQAAEETKQEAERYRQEILGEAQNQANRIVSEAEEKAESIVRGVRERVKQLKMEAEEAESRRQYALEQLQELAQRMMQQVENAQHLPVDDAIEESERLLEEAEQAAHEHTNNHQMLAAGDSLEKNDTPEDVSYNDSAVASAYEEETERTVENDDLREHPSAPLSPEEAEETYEPAYADDENEARPSQEPIAAKVKRGSFFDEID